MPWILFPVYSDHALDVVLLPSLLLLVELLKLCIGNVDCYGTKSLGKHICYFMWQKSAKHRCQLAFKTWLGNKSDELIEKAHEGNASAVWHLVRILKRCKKQPRIAAAPVHDAQGTVVKDKETLTPLWPQQFSEYFSGNVVGISQTQAHVLLRDRRAQSSQLSCRAHAHDFNGPQGLPNTCEEWVDFVHARLAKARTCKKVGLDGIPNELYSASGNPGQLLPAQLLHRATHAGPPVA